MSTTENRPDLRGPRIMRARFGLSPIDSTERPNPIQLPRKPLSPPPQSEYREMNHAS
jgi:hypothetical protein